MRKDVYILKESDIRRKDNKKIRVTFLGYRSWALTAIKEVCQICRIEVIDLIESNEEYQKKVLQYKDGYVDCIVLLGWSWIITEDILKRFLCVGIHPSDLPMFRGGSPIQHQIINGLETTKISLMTISENGVDIGDIWAKEEWDMTGNTMKVIFEHLKDSSVKLLKNFFDNFYDLSPVPQNLKEGSYYERRKPEDSKVTWELLSTMDLKKVYNLIRALTDPYPNIYIEDHAGNRLYFKEVEFSESL